MRVETESGKVLKVISRDIDGQMTVIEGDKPKILDENVKRIIFEGLYEIVKNILSWLFGKAIKTNSAQLPNGGHEITKPEDIQL